jgi:hypothetical protein
MSVALAVGLPVLGGTLIAVMALVRGWCLKGRELKLQEKRIQMEEKLRSDELNARILRVDDVGVTPAELASVAEEMRQLRQEVAQLRQEMNSRTFT